MSVRSLPPDFGHFAFERQCGIAEAQQDAKPDCEWVRQDFSHGAKALHLLLRTPENR